MSVTLDQIKELRERTGVSTMACKKALEESGADMDAAIDILRKKGDAKAASREARTTANGICVVKTAEGRAALISLLCETDFVAKNEDFVAMGESLAEKLLSGELTESSCTTIPDDMKDTVIKMGEKITIGDGKVLSGPTIGTYVHSNSRIGVIVVLEGGNEELARDVAMHAAATNPACLSPQEVSEEEVAREKAIWIEQLAKEGKPAEIIEKIMMGKEKKFREENALLKQPFVKNPEQTIEQLVETAGAKVLSFARLAV